jgi:hypothetical protein
MKNLSLSPNLAISESGFLFLPTTGESFTVTEVGRSILLGLQAGKSEGDIVHSVVQEFEIDAATVERDLRDFMSQLQQYRLVSNDNDLQSD